MNTSRRQGLALTLSVVAWSHAAVADEPQKRMTLEQVLAHAEANAPSLAIALGRAKRGDAERTAAAPLFPSNPSLALSGGGRFGGGQNGGDFEAGLSQQLEIAGEQGLRRELAERRVAAFEADLARARFDVHRLVHVSFHTALLAEDAQRGAEDGLKYAEQLLDIASKQVQAGEESPLAEKLARAEVSRAKEQLLAATQGATTARLDLALMAGLPRGIEVVPDGTLPTPQATAPLASLVELAQKSQPELRLRRAEVSSGKARLALADREAFPKPALGVVYAAEGVAPGSNATQQIIVGTLEISLPLWRQNDGERAFARAELEIAEAEERALLQTLENRVARAKTRVDSDAKRIALHVTEVLPAVDENVKLIQQAFALGETDITAVMLARERLISSRREALDAYRDYFSALAELEAEVGAEVVADDAQGETR